MQLPACRDLHLCGRHGLRTQNKGNLSVATKVETSLCLQVIQKSLCGRPLRDGQEQCKSVKARALSRQRVTRVKCIQAGLNC